MAEFCNAWNHHHIRTANHKSPHQLFTAGLLLLQHSQLTAFDFFQDVDTSYGVDEEGPESLDEGTVTIPEVNIHLSSADYQQLCRSVDPLSPSENYGMDLYEQSIEFIDSL